MPTVKDITMALIIMSAIVFYAFRKSSATEEKMNAAGTTQNGSIAADSEKELIQWMSFEEAFNACKKSPRPIIVDVFTKWCGPCKLMAKETFNNPIIANYINNKYYAVKFDAESKDTVRFDKYTFVSTNPEEAKAPHQFAVSVLDGQMAYPSIVFLNQDVKRLDVIKGFNPPQAFEPIMKFYGSGAYASQSWDDYNSKFVSEMK